jgi:acylpyruvate hydrolase
MKLATIRTPGAPAGATAAVRLDEASGSAVELGAADLAAFLRNPDWRARAADAAGARHALADLDYAPLVVSPEKILCVGLNYRAHILEMGRELPQYPTLFAKYARSLVGAHDQVLLPAASTAMDWEAELGVVVGATLRHADEAEASAGIAGYTVVNDVTARDWQYRSGQWLQGKTWEASTPIGPWLVVAETETTGSESWPLVCTVNGETVQKADTGDLVFSPAALLSYISTIITLVPGDLIATGTPGGVGHARKPPRYLQDGDVVVTRIGGVGECRNVFRSEAAQ